MTRRSGRVGPRLAGGQAADPGKDLFAFLFIMIMVFSGMLLLTTKEQADQAQAAPRSTRSGSIALEKVAEKKIGSLRRIDGEIYLLFNGRRYHPIRDFEELAAADLFTQTVSGSDGQRTLLLEAGDAGKVSLSEYLEAFQFLGSKQIDIAFAERIN